MFNTVFIYMYVDEQMETNDLQCCLDRLKRGFNLKYVGSVDDVKLTVAIMKHNKTC